MNEEQIIRARTIVSQAKEFENNLDRKTLENLSSEDIDRLVQGQKIEEIKEENILRR